jgi:hypothetical protein
MKRKILFLSALLFLTACEEENNEREFLKFYGDAREDIGYSIAMADDGYLICGKLSIITRTPEEGIETDSSRLGIIKTGFDGNTIWKKSFGGRFEGIGSKVVVLDDGSIICTGYIVDPDPDNNPATEKQETDIFVVKLNADGSGALEKRFVSLGNQAGCDILQTDEGFIILATTDVGQSDAESSGNIEGKKDILLLRLNTNLEEIQTLPPIGFPGNDYGAAIKHDVGGGYIIVGTTDKPDPERANNNIFLWKINTNGSATEPVFIGSNDDEYAADIEVVSNGYLITGTVGAPGIKQSVYIAGIPSNIYSPPTFTKKIEQSTDSWSVTAMSRYKSNYFVLAGKSGTASLSKMLIIAMDAEGNQLEGKEVITGSAGVQAAYDVISDNEGYIIAVGKDSHESNSMISLLKFKF